MKTAKIVPSVCKSEGAVWEGSVTLRLPTFDEKFDYIEKMQVHVKDGEAEASNLSNLRAIREMVRISKDHYVEVSLVNKETKEEIKSFDDLQCCDELHSVLVEVATTLLNGVKVGNG